MTTKPELVAWFNRGIEQGATHMIVVCDTYDHEDFPVYVSPGEDARIKASDYNAAVMAKVMEVYDLRLDRDQQMAQHRVFNY